MKTRLLTSLLVVLAVALCALYTYQWMRGTAQRKDIQSLNNHQLQLESEIEQHTNRIHYMDARIAELANDITRFQDISRTNENTITELRNNVSLLENSNQWLQAQLNVYTNAFNQATNQLSEAYENIKKQNALIQQVARERDEFVTKLNQSVEERNRVVAQYNELVGKVEQIQSQIDAHPPRPVTPSRSP
jgi:chromosome segregation ATPase